MNSHKRSTLLTHTHKLRSKHLAAQPNLFYISKKNSVGSSLRNTEKNLLLAIYFCNENDVLFYFLKTLIWPFIDSIGECAVECYNFLLCIWPYVSSLSIHSMKFIQIISMKFCDNEYYLSYLHFVFLIPRPAGEIC